MAKHGRNAGMNGGAAAAAIAMAACAASAGWVFASGPQHGRSAQADEPVVENSCVAALRMISGWCGDGGPAKLALLSDPASLAVLADGSIAFTDADIAAVRRVRPDGVIERVAGIGRAGFSGDGGPAIKARISAGASIAALPDGGFLLADAANHRVRQVFADGVIRTVAGTGRPGAARDGVPATQARLSYPLSVSALPGGGFLIVDADDHRVLRVDARGVMSTVAGTGERGTAGDGGPATVARLNGPSDVVALRDGGFVLVDSDPAQFTRSRWTDRLRKVSATGRIETVLSFRNRRLRSVSSGPDGSLAVVVDNAPARIDAAGGLELASRQVCPAGPPWRRVDPGDGGPAARARLAAADVAVATHGSLLVADWMFSRIRRIDPAHTITTIAGGGGVRGRVHMRDQPCGGASPDYAEWNYFGIIRARAKGRRAIVLQFGTTLSARVTLSARRRGKTVARRRVNVPADTHLVRLSVRPGRYRLVLRGRHGDLTASDRAVVRVR